MKVICRHIIIALIVLTLLLTVVCVPASANSLYTTEEIPSVIHEQLKIGTMMQRILEQCRAWAQSLCDTAKHNVIDIDTNKDILFIGNSLTQGIRYSVESENDFLSKNGVSLDGLNLAAIHKMEFKVVIINMGTNELGHYGEERFKNSYQKLIEVIRDVNPDARIICCSVPPVATRTQYAREYNNENVQLYNKYIQEICAATDTEYLDNAEFFGDVLKDDWTGDGLHFTGVIYKKWYEFLISKI